MGVIAKAVLGLAGLAMLAACRPAEQPHRPGRPSRIVSLDYCADQYVLRLSPREDILAVSPDAEKTFSYMRSHAKGLRQIRPRAEAILALQPDLVVRSYGGGSHVTALIERTGTPVLQVNAFAPDLAGVRDTIAAVAAGLGQPARGAGLIAEMNARLAALPTLPDAPEALYMTPAGATSGPGTLAHEMLRAAGLVNFQQEPGWRSLPLERLASEQPELLAAVRWGATNTYAWSTARHPIARRQLRERPTVHLEGAWVACGGWFLLDAIEALATRGGATAR